MNVHWHPSVQIQRFAQVRLRSGPQRMRRNADTAIGWQRTYRFLAQRDNVRKRFDRITKAQLSASKRLGLQATISIQHGQMGQSNTGQSSSLYDLQRQFRPVVIGMTAGLMVHIMKFPNRGVSSFLHFHKCQSCDRRDMIRAQMVEKAVH